MGNQASSLNSRWIWIAGYIGFWTLLALIGAAQAYVSQLIFDKPVSWDLALRRSFKEWYAYGVLALGILWWCQRIINEPSTRRWFLFHLSASPVFAITYVALVSWLLSGETSVQTGQVLTFSYLFKKLAIHYIIMNLTMYWVVVSAHWGLHYYRRYKEREVQTAQLQRELSESRLAALRMELNPHFLFNTLHAVSCLIHTNPEAADRVVARLSELLRSTLDQSKPQEVPLSEEIKFLEKYLEIEQTRFQERLSVEKEIPADTHCALVPYLILQPIVENAIRHGIEPKETAGKLSIRTRRQNGTLEIRIADNGAGLQMEKGKAPAEGIGLSNTRSRLIHLYGDRQTLRLSNAEAGGLEVHIEIPFHTESKVN